MCFSILRTSQKEQDQGNNQYGHYHIEGFHAYGSPFFKDQYRESDYGRNTDNLSGQIKAKAIVEPVKERLKSFCKGDDIEGHRNCLGNKEGKTDSGPDIKPKGPGYDKVFSTTFHSFVSGYFGDCQGGRNSHQVAQKDHTDYSPESQGTNCKTKSQKENGSQNSCYSGEIDRSCPESFCCRVCHIFI